MVETKAAENEIAKRRDDTYLLPQSLSCLRIVANLPQRGPRSESGLGRYSCFSGQSVLILAAGKAGILLKTRGSLVSFA